MAILGAAYVQVRADLRDYDAALDAALKKSTDKFEKALGKSLGSKVGKGAAAAIDAEMSAGAKRTAKKVADELEEAGKEGGRRGGISFFKAFDAALNKGSSVATGIGGLVTDGLSGLPPEFKLAFGSAIAAAAPVVLAGIEGAVGAGIAAGVAGIGIALASEYQVIEEGGRKLGQDLRATLVGAAEPFVGELLASFGKIDAFFDSIQGRLNNIFRLSSTFVGPLTNGLLGFFDLATRGLESFVDDGGEYVDALGDGLYFLGSAVEQVLTDFGELGEEGSQALRDVLYAGADIIVFLGDLIRLSTLAYNGFREMATGTEWWQTAMKILLPGLALADIAFSDIDDATKEADEALKAYDATSNEFIDTEGRSIRVTNAQTKALQEQADAINDLRDAQLDSIGSLVDYHETLDDLAKSAKANKGAFDFKTEGGRENIDNYRKALQDAQEAATNLYLAGELNEEQAQAYYDQLVEDATRAATSNGILKSSIDKVFGSITTLIGLPPVPNKFGLLASAAAAAEASVRQLNAEMNRSRFTPNSTLPPATGMSSTTSGTSSARQSQGLGGYAEGAIVTQEHQAWVAENNRPEVILPLTNPRRTRELAAQSGLMNILGGDGAQVFNVYVGNEQLDSRTFRIVKASGAASARMANAAPRMI